MFLAHRCGITEGQQGTEANSKGASIETNSLKIQLILTYVLAGCWSVTLTFDPLYPGYDSI